MLRPRLVEGLSPAQALHVSEGYLRRHEVESPRRTAELLLMHVRRTDRAGLYVGRNGLTREEAAWLKKALSERASGVPLQHVVERQQFMDLDLHVRPGVFIPRPETERLVEAALELLHERLAEPLVLDVGTGTGAIALAIKRFVPGARVIATDVSAAAVEVARKNSQQLGLDVEVVQGDLLDPVPREFRGEVDVLVSNPPYVNAEEYDSLPAEVKAEPREALVGGTEFHRRLVDAAVDWLTPGGWLLTEIGDDQADEVRRLFDEQFSDVQVLTDFAGRSRIVRGSLSER